jgi:hypothetical protein
MNDKTKKKDVGGRIAAGESVGNLNKAEIGKLLSAGMSASKIIEKIMENPVMRMKDLPGNLNKAELFALGKADTKKEQKKIKDMFGKEYVPLKETKIEIIPIPTGEPLKGKRPALAKGGMVKKYMGGGSVHKNKNKMITTRGWGASRKT